MKTIVIKESGWLDVTVRTAHGEAPVRLDALRASNCYSAICREHPGGTERGAAWVRWLVDNGVPELSHGGAFRLAAAIIAHLKKLAEHDRAPAAPAPDGAEKEV